MTPAPSHTLHQDLADEAAQLDAHYQLARWMASSRYHQIPYDDRLQACLIGLLKAIRGYDPSESRFSTYAAVCMGNELSALAAKQGYRIAVPEHAAGQVRRAACLHAVGTQPVAEDIRTRTNQARPTLEALAAVPGPAYSLDQPTDGDPNPLHDRIPSNAPDPADEVADRQDRAAMSRALLDVLDPRSRRICEQYYVAGRTMREISAEVGVTYQRVQQILVAAVARIRKAIAERS